MQVCVLVLPPSLFGLFSCANAGILENVSVDEERRLFSWEKAFCWGTRDAVHKCQWSVEIIRCGDQDLLPFLLRICDPKGRFFHAKFPSNISHPATNQLGSPCWHSHRGFRWPYSPRSQTLLPAGLHQAEWLWWGFYATKQVTLWWSQNLQMDLNSKWWGVIFFRIFWETVFPSPYLISNHHHHHLHLHGWKKIVSP